MFFCDTPYQSIVIALISGISAGFAGIYYQSVFAVLIIAVTLGILLEIMFHQIRQDEQFKQTKKQLFS